MIGRLLTLVAIVCMSAPMAAATTVTNLTLLPDTPVSGVSPGGVEGDAAPGWGTGSWQAAVPVGATSPNHYTQLYLTPDSLFGRDVTVGELASISYYTKKDTLHSESSSDWFFQFYTKPYDGSPGSTWYGNRINAEPYFSQNLNAPAETWNQWVTEEGQDNRLRFYDSSSGYFGGYGDGFLSDLTSNAIYSDQEILYITVGLGTAWAAGFTGRIDGLRIELTDGSVANVNFEVIPEPASLALLGLGGLLMLRRRGRLAC